MKTKKINEVRKQIEYEYKRNSYPDGFPKIPDISGKRYTDQEFFDLEKLKTTHDLLTDKESLKKNYSSSKRIIGLFDEDGIDNDIDPGQPENRNIYQAMEEGKQVKKLPMSLGEALDRLANDDVIRSSMPGKRS